MTSRRLTLATALRYSLSASLCFAAIACGGTHTAEPSKPSKPSEVGTHPSCSSPSIDPRTGLTDCAEGYRHRPEPTHCSLESNTAQVLCKLDCSDVPNGFCLVGERPEAQTCQRGCTEDTDCPSGNVCFCGVIQSPSGGMCISSHCQVDADCDDGYLCASAELGCGETTFLCQTAEDECWSESDCEGCGYNEPTQNHPARQCDAVGSCSRP